MRLPKGLPPGASQMTALGEQAGEADLVRAWALTTTQAGPDEPEAI